jgi:hypothetical protein
LYTSISIGMVATASTQYRHISIVPTRVATYAANQLPPATIPSRVGLRASVAS